MLKSIAETAAFEAMRAALRSETERLSNELCVNPSCVTLEFGYYPDSEVSGEKWHYRAVLWSPDGDHEACGEGTTPRTAGDDLIEACQEAQERQRRRKKRKRSRGGKQRPPQ